MPKHINVNNYASMLGEVTTEDYTSLGMRSPGEYDPIQGRKPEQIQPPPQTEDGLPPGTTEQPSIEEAQIPQTQPETTQPQPQVQKTPALAPVPQAQQPSPAALDWNNPAAVIPHTWKRKLADGTTREYSGLTVEQIQGFVGLGLNASDRGQELNQWQSQLQQWQGQEQQKLTQERQSFETERKQFTDEKQGLEPAFKFDKAMKDITPFREAVYAAWDEHVGNQAQPGGAQNPGMDYMRQQLREDILKEVNPHLETLKQQQQFFQTRENAEYDRQLDEQLQTCRREHASAPWDLPDHITGLTLDKQICKAIETGEAKTVEKAYWMLRGPQERAAAEQAARVRSTEDFQKKQSLGVTLNGAPSKPGTQQAKDGLDLKYLRDKKGDMAYRMSQDPNLLALLEGPD